MTPQSQLKPKKNSSKVNLTISFIVHAVIIGALIYFAAREGYLGKKIQKISVQMIKEKKVEKPKEPPKVEPPKVEPPKIVETPKVVEPPKTVTAPPTVAPPVVAPPNTELPAFEFGGGKTVQTESNPVQLYKGYIEYELRQKWDRPEDMQDYDFVAEVQVNVDKQGNLSNPVWKKGSGNARWDDTVKQVFKDVHNIDRPPPTNFPPQVIIRFDVQEQTEPAMTQ